MFGDQQPFGTASAFGGSGIALTGTRVKFNPPTGTDTVMNRGVSQSISLRFCCITIMEEYKNKSLEELRFEYYDENRKGVSAAVKKTGLFEQQAVDNSACRFGNTIQNELFFDPARNTTNVQAPNTAEILWTVEGIKTKRFSASVSKCKFFLECLERSEWGLKMNASPNGLESSLFFYSSDSDSVMVDWDICLLTSDGKRWKKGFSGERQNLSKNKSHSGLLVSWSEILDTNTGLLFQDSVTVSIRIWPSLSSLPYPLTLTARSSGGGIPREVTWEVKQFSTLDTGDEKEYVVPKMRADDEEIKIVLLVTRDELCVLFNSIFDGSLMVKAVHIVQKNGTEMMCWEGQMLITNLSFNLLPFIKICSLIEKQDKLLPNDTLTIILKYIDYINYSECSPIEMVDGRIPTKLIMSTCSPHQQVRSTSPPPVTPTVDVGTNTEEVPPSLGCQLSVLEDLATLFEKATFSDFSLQAGDECIPVHRAVLCARSPVFAAMLECPMRETDVPDFAPDCVRRMARFLYCGTVPDLGPTDAVQLYALADKYGVLELRDLCATALASGLCALSVCDVLLLSDRHSDGKLKARVVDFIRQNDIEILQSPQWVTFMKENPVLSLEVAYDIHLKRFTN